MNPFKRIFSPEVIALIGASNREGSVGYSLMSNLLGNGYEGVVYPVHPTRKSVHGVRAYASVAALPEKIDLALISVPVNSVLDVVRECGEAGAAGAVIITAGFGELGEEGKERERKILEVARHYGMRLIGPNCLGFLRPSIKLNASFAPGMARMGRIAFVSQSGALCTSILDWSLKHNVGFSYFVSLGAMLDVGYHDLIDYFGSDPDTDSIVIYMESLMDARRFMSAARAFSRTKPIIVLKSGRSSEGAKAAMSHTGSIAGNDFLFDAAFKRAGVIRVRYIGDLFNIAQTLAMQERPAGKRLAIVTNAGGPGVIAADSLSDEGGELVELSPNTIERLNEHLPFAWSHGNPVDILGDADPKRFRKALEAIEDDPGVDGILVILTPQSMTEPVQVAHSVVEVAKRSSKTVLSCWMGEDSVEEGRRVLETGGVPAFRIPESAVRCFVIMYRYKQNLDLLYETPSSIPEQFAPDVDGARKLIRNIMSEGRTTLTEREGMDLLSLFKIPVLPAGVATTTDEAKAIATRLGYPLVLKILSPQILHKTDVGGVLVGIMSEEDLLVGYHTILETVKKRKPEAEIQGILVEKMVQKRYEILIGGKKDPIFGPAVVFGLGGVSVEIFRDTSAGLPPLNMALAMRIIEDTKIYRMLKGFRGIPGADIQSIQFLLYKFSYLLAEFPEIKEMDINPFAVDESGGVVLDARILLEKEPPPPDFRPYSHLVISPYPEQYVRKVCLLDGMEVILRPIKPEDEPLEREMFRHLSEESLRFRFFQVIRHITHAELTRFTHIDYDREIAIVAEAQEDDERKMLGVVRLIADPYGEEAEFAIVVADPWRKKGLGNIFTDYILDIARERGLKRVIANLLKDNDIMLHIFKRRNFSVESAEEDIYRVWLDL